LRYWQRHGPCPVAHVSAALGVDRSDIYRILRRFTDFTPREFRRIKSAA
jgi:hypothetical protein